MLPLQVILIASIVLMVLRLLYQLKKKNINLGQFLIWLIIWLSAIVVIWYPQVTTYLADILGVGRGVDLVIYVSVVAVFYLMFRLLVRIEKIERDITKIVRSDAIENKPDDGKK
jgi:hypothetical protein